MNKVQTVLGHQSTEMSRRYAEYLTEELADIVKGRRVHRLFIPNQEPKQLELKPKVVGGTGIEPATSPTHSRDALTIQNYLYDPFHRALVGGTGIEPATSGL